MMLRRQNSAGNINVIVHMNTDDNIQVVPIAGKSTCPTTRNVYFADTACDMGQHSTVDISQIPLTVNNDFFMDSHDEKDDETCDIDKNSVRDENDHHVLNYGVNNDQRWSPVSNSNNRTFADNYKFNTEIQPATVSQTFTDSFQFHAGNNTDLQKATDEALKTGTISPLVKEELKCSVQSKRLKEGKSELTVQFEDPKPDILTPEEEEKVELRRTQNREAARRFRDRQKKRTDELQKECRKLETENSKLRYEIVKLRKEKDDLSVKFQQHLTICPLGGAVNPGFYSEVT